MLGKRKTASVAPPPKRRKKAPAIDEISFDFSAREDYLTGFHKRKLQRIKHAQEEAAKKERQERIAARKRLREGRKEDLEKHVEAVNLALREADGILETPETEDDSTAQDEWDGIVEVLEVDHEEEYVDEDRHTTVTVEAVDVTKDGLLKVAVEKEDDDESDDGPEYRNTSTTGKTGPDARNPSSGKRVWTKERPGGPKKKKKKFRYESKAERKVTRHKERSGSRAKAKTRKE
ncbi:MAG: hypothetical protein FRX48_03993 [Lasallia pustulata]|uniref:Nucleolar protein 12 n=1 Tax=Lasallia pustulata TaxID=136370 RepID=A0A5M8PQM5_9LECA|nr:MAG: hypothetical protein FRX48_03993 [Lasallia pustulata]